MRNSPMCEFPVEEFTARITALVVKMKEAGLDGMMLSNRENTRYFCGLQSIIWSSKVSTPGILLVNADGKTALIGSASAVETARYTSVLEDEDVFCFDRNALPGTPATYPDAVVSAFHQLGLAHGRIGAEFGDSCYLQLQYHWYLELCEQMPEIQFVDASQIIFALRSVKSPAEIDLLAHACQQNEASLSYAISTIIPGRTTEREVYRSFAQEAYRRHCENVMELSVRFSPERLPLSTCPSGNTVITDTPHAPLVISGGLFIHGYYSNMERAAVVGSLTAQQQMLFDWAHQTTQRMCDLFHDGTDLQEAIRQIDEFALASPAGAYYQAQNMLGFGIGLDPCEPPYLERSAQLPVHLRAGMVLQVAPRFGSPELGYFTCSTVLEVINSGVRLLSSLPDQPAILC